MNEFFFTVIVLCAVCALIECLLPKKNGDLGALCSLFVAVCVIGVFSFSDGFEFPSSAPVEYDEAPYYAFTEACEARVLEICDEYGVPACSATVVSSDGTTVDTLTVEAEENEELAAYLRKIFGCEVSFE